MLPPGQSIVSALLAGFRRAAAAARRYEELKRTNPATLGRAGRAPADIPRWTFEEFYTIDGDIGVALRDHHARVATAAWWPIHHQVAAPAPPSLADFS